MRIARSTVRAQTRATNGFQSPDEAAIARSVARQTALNVILGQGCGDCSGCHYLNDDGSTVECPLLAYPQLAERLAPEQRAAAAGCAIPALYADVFSGKTAPETVTVEGVHAACPFIVVEETG